MPGFDGASAGRVFVGLPPCVACLADKIDGEVSDIYIQSKARNITPEIPASDEGVKAARTLAAAGIPFIASGVVSRRRAGDFINAYFQGLEDRGQKDLDAGQAAMGLHVPVGRIDAAMDPLLEKRRAMAPIETIRAAYRVLIGRVGVSTAKMIHRDLKRQLNSARWDLLAAKKAVEPFCVFTFQEAPGILPPKSEELWGPGAFSVVSRPDLAAAALKHPTLEADCEDARFNLDKLANYQIDRHLIASEIEGGLL
jgi:hypothetical protein